ncbi:hypothetical protein DL93DRAFT_543740 [Clavulina sp. PMI_390]|nr:hypothetical protein DL93DRAFT_543740 [Clavulina sp. PMI_390]
MIFHLTLGSAFHSASFIDSRRSGTPSRFDPSFYRTHDPLAYIPDGQPTKGGHQPGFSSGLPFSTTGGPFAHQNGSGRPNGGAPKRPGFGGYASSVISQDIGGSSALDTNSVVGTTPSERGGPASLAYSQSDRLRRRLSQSSFAGISDIGSNLSALDYKTQDEAADLDDMRSQYSQSQSGFTEF